MRLFFFWLLLAYVHPSFSSTCLNVLDFGAKGDGITDDYLALQTTIDSAKILGATVCIPSGAYKCSSTLFIGAGVRIAGEGMGKTSLKTPKNGSLIIYTDTTTAIKIEGSNVSLENIVLLDDNNSGGQNGIIVEANDTLVESVSIKNVLISGFAEGTAFKLSAINEGGIAYCSFYDLRVRHARIGISIYEDETSFVNSNSFFQGAISGGAFNIGLHVQGGNNNLFFGTVIEPPSSTLGHIVVETGVIIGHNIRIEGSKQADSIPMIHFNNNANQSYLSGHFAGGPVRNNGNNIIAMSSSRYIGEENNAENQFLNSSFFCDSVSDTPDFWEITGTGVATELQEPSIVRGFHVLKITVPGSIQCKIYPQLEIDPKAYSHSLYTYSNFNVYVKTDQKETVKTYMSSQSGISTSAPHNGDNSWQLIGLQTRTPDNGDPLPKILIDNTLNLDSTIVYITSPSFTFGQNLPKRVANNINGNGGVMMGTLTSGMSENYSYITGTKYLVLEKNGNYFNIKGNHNIHRINHKTADRFLKGTVITLLFDTIGSTVSNGSYLKLKSSFSTLTSNSSLTLISNGNGTWREVSRNN